MVNKHAKAINTIEEMHRPAVNIYVTNVDCSLRMARGLLSFEFIPRSKIRCIEQE
jgi:hypothetical protein